MKNTPIATSEDMIDNKLELLKHISTVQSRIRKNITSDFILAKIPEDRKEAIIEMTSIAYYSSNIIKNLAKKATKWTFIKKENKWKQTNINQETKEKMINASQRMFESYMIRVEMMAILHRNVKKNHIVQLIAGIEEEKTDEEEETRGILERIKENLTKKGGE